MPRAVVAAGARASPIGGWKNLFGKLARVVLFFLSLRKIRGERFLHYQGWAS